MVAGFPALELAVGTTYAIMGKAEPLAAAVPVVAGFYQVFPLTPTEIECLYELIAMRLCLSVAISAEQRKAEPANEYLSFSEKPAWSLLAQWRNIHPDFAHFVFRGACGLPSCPQTEKIIGWLMEHRNELGPVIDIDLEKDRPLLFDLSVGSPELSTWKDPEDMEELSGLLSGRMAAARTRVRTGIGRRRSHILIVIVPGRGGFPPSPSCVIRPSDIFFLLLNPRREVTSMEYRTLGRSGLKISALSFGSWVTFSDQMGEDVATSCMKTAYDAGVNFFDNAEAYARGRAEIMMGDILRKSGWRRSDLVISTKIFWGGRGVNDRGLSRKHIIEGTNAALLRLQMDYVDLIYCHRPDVETPIEETVWAMNQVIHQGKAFYWGTSEWSAREITEACCFARQEHLIPPTMEQPQYNMFTRKRVEKEYAPLYREFGLGTTIWSPLAGGLLTGKYEAGIPPGTRVTLPGYEWLRERYVGSEAEVRVEKVRRLRMVADELGATPAQLALAWCLKNPNVSSVITGASRPEQVVENMAAMEIVGRLSPEIMERIETILDNKPPLEPNLR